jgi:hypothetical protein
MCTKGKEDGVEGPSQSPVPNVCMPRERMTIGFDGIGISLLNRLPINICGEAISIQNIDNLERE